jgi:hypothetical protein
MARICIQEMKIITGLVDHWANGNNNNNNNSNFRVGI